MAMRTITGDRSRPPVFQGGKRRRTGARTGSVAMRRNITIGLRGSGLTHEISAAAMITHEYRLSRYPVKSTKGTICSERGYAPLPNLPPGIVISEGGFAPLPNLPPGIVAPAKPALEH